MSGNNFDGRVSCENNRFWVYELEWKPDEISFFKVEWDLDSLSGAWIIQGLGGKSFGKFLIWLREIKYFCTWAYCIIDCFRGVVLEFIWF